MNGEGNRPIPTYWPIDIYTYILYVLYIHIICIDNQGKMQRPRACAIESDIFQTTTTVVCQASLIVVAGVVAVSQFAVRSKQARVCYIIVYVVVVNFNFSFVASI